MARIESKSVLVVPSSNQEDFKNLRFVLKALRKQKDDFYTYQSLVHVEDKRVYATDGKRLHSAPFDADDGNYSVVHNLNAIILEKNTTIKFPNVKQLCDLYAMDPAKIKDSFKLKSHLLIKGEIAAYAAVKIYSNFKRLINIEYILDLGDLDWNVSLEKKDDGAIYIYSTKFPLFALIMPLCVNAENI